MLLMIRLLKNIWCLKSMRYRHRLIYFHHWSQKLTPFLSRKNHVHYTLLLHTPFILAPEYKLYLYDITKYHLRLEEKNQWGIESAITFKRRQVLKLYETTGTTSIIHIHKYDRTSMVRVYSDDGEGIDRRLFENRNIDTYIHYYMYTVQLGDLLGWQWRSCSWPSTKREKKIECACDV